MPLDDLPASQPNNDPQLQLSIGDQIYTNDLNKKSVNAKDVVVNAFRFFAKCTIDCFSSRS